jgi:anti-sigma factor RsiW
MTNCQQSSESLSDFVDGLLEPVERAALSAHLTACESCRGLVDDLTRLKDAAGSLGPIVPPTHIWENIQASLPSAKRQARTQWMGLAAALVLVTTGAYFFTRLTAPDAASLSTSIGTSDAAHAGNSNANATATVETVEQELANAAEHFEKAIAQLEAVAKRDNALPADAAAKLQISLSQVDTGIAASRAALAIEPQSGPARDSLFSALRKKVEILQQTVALVGAMQRGDRETTAKVLDGKKS